MLQWQLKGKTSVIILHFSTFKSMIVCRFKPKLRKKRNLGQTVHQPKNRSVHLGLRKILY